MENESQRENRDFRIHLPFIFVHHRSLMRLLLIEDEPDLLSGLTRALRRAGYSVDAAEDGEDGLFKALEIDYDAIILAVAHHQFKDMGATAIRALGQPTAVLYDLKYVLSAQESDLRL